MRRGRGEGGAPRPREEAGPNTRRKGHRRGRRKERIDRVDSCVCRGKEDEPKEADILLGLRWGRLREGG